MTERVYLGRSLPCTPTFCFSLKSKTIANDQKDLRARRQNLGCARNRDGECLFVFVIQIGRFGIPHALVADCVVLRYVLPIIEVESGDADRLSLCEIREVILA